MANVFKLTNDPHAELQALLAQYDSANPAAPESLSLDLGELAVVDSLLLGQLLKLHVRMRRLGARVELINIPPHCFKTLMYAKLDKLFVIPDRERSASGISSIPSA